MMQQTASIVWLVDTPQHLTAWWDGEQTDLDLLHTNIHIQSASSLILSSLSHVQPPGRPWNCVRVRYVVGKLPLKVIASPIRRQQAPSSFPWCVGVGDNASEVLIIPPRLLAGNLENVKFDTHI